MSVDEIAREIAELEKADTNWSNIQKLSWLYTVFDHMSEDRIPIVSHAMVDTVPEYDLGEFSRAASGVPVQELMSLLEEHMQVVRALYPKEYEAVLERIAQM